MNAFREIFEQCFLVIGGVGLVLTLTALFLCAWNCWVSERISALCAAWKRSSFVTRVVSVAFVGILMAYASTKPPENGQEGRYLCLVSSLPEGQSEASDPDPHRGETILTREWNLPGAWQYSMRRQDFAGGFVFPYGTNHLACVHVSSQGSVRETRFSTNVIASVGVPLAVVPGLTECSHEYTVSNTYRFVWANAAAYRDTNTLVSASVELFRNGDVVVTTNGITRTIPRELPFEHDGYGQDESWVRANFAMLQDVDASLTNVEQVLSIGYTNWVDRLVGVGQLNGLYKFTAEFTEDPPETTQFWIGDFSLAVTNAGKYVVVLKKGEEYEFGTWPFNDDVDYWAQDDLAADAPMLTSWWGDWESPGEWSIDGGWNWFWQPDLSEWGYQNGYCCMMPTLRGSPDIVHLRQESFPARFEADLIDYPHSETVGYLWSTPDENIVIHSPNSRVTDVSASSFPATDRFRFSVSANVGSGTLESHIVATYGTNAYPSVAIELNVPRMVFVNDDFRESRFYEVSCSLYSPVETNVTVCMRHQGDTFANFHQIRDVISEYDINARRSIYIPAGETVTAMRFYFGCVETGRGTLFAEVSDASGVVNQAEADYSCIEPLQRLVTVDSATDGRCVNPSRLVYGTNSTLSIRINGSYQPSNVRWLHTGPVRICETNGLSVVVEPTSDTGTAKVWAAIGGDNNIQPYFELPIVKPRRFDLQVYYVCDNKGRLPKSLSRVEKWIKTANCIYSQVGVSFALQGSPTEIGDDSYYVLPGGDWVTAADNKVVLSRKISQKALALDALAPTSTCFKVFCVGEIVQTTGIAFAAKNLRSVFVANKGSNAVLAHELGHLFGLEDIYSEKDIDGTTCRIPRSGSSPDITFFSDTARDWPGLDGRGFYSSGDYCEELIANLLMCGNDAAGDGDLRDIPSGAVEGYGKYASHRTDVEDLEVGASKIESEGELK